MRLLAPTRRTPKANKSDVVFANDELAELRRRKALYGEEANKELAKFNQLKSDFESEKVSIESKTKELADSLNSTISSLEANKTSLEETIKGLEQSADANKYRKLIVDLEVSMLDLERQKEFYAGELFNLGSKREALESLSDELDERNAVCEAMEYSLLSVKTKLEDDTLEAEKQLEDRVCRLDTRESILQGYNTKLEALQLDLQAKERTIDVYKEQLSIKGDDLLKQERYLADRKAKLDSLIAHYELKIKS